MVIQYMTSDEGFYFIFQNFDHEWVDTDYYQLIWNDRSESDVPETGGHCDGRLRYW